MVLQNLVRWYRNAALLLLNTVLLFLIFNGLIWVFGLVRPNVIEYPSPPPQTSVLPVYGIGALNYDFEKLQQSRPHMKSRKIILTMLETGNIERVCNSDTLFREQPFKGHTVTVDPAGFRWIQDQASWPPDENSYNIFVFGGSTTFGYGEVTNHTIPSFLQQDLKRKGYKTAVYNFGHSGFIALQEKWELERLVRDGFVPDMAVFIDGLNDLRKWDGQPRGIAGTACRPDDSDPAERWRKMLICRHDEWCWPVQRLVTHLNAANKKTWNPPDNPRSSPPANDAATNEAIISRWLENKKTIEEIAVAHDMETLFVLQPIPGYAHDLANHIFMDRPGDDAAGRAQWAYPLWEELAAADTEQKWTANFLNLSHLGQNKQDPIYIDKIHYTGKFMEEIAQSIAKAIIERQLIRPGTEQEP